MPESFTDINSSLGQTSGINSVGSNLIGSYRIAHLLNNSIEGCCTTLWITGSRGRSYHPCGFFSFYQKQVLYLFDILYNHEDLDP